MGGTAVACTVCIGPGVQLHSIECDTSVANWYLTQKRAYLTIEAIAIHPQICGSMPKAQQTWRKRGELHGERLRGSPAGVCRVGPHAQSARELLSVLRFD